MRLVGRERELAQTRSALEAGRNVLLTGAYGIGRTALAQELATRMTPSWRFVFLDAASKPAAICQHICRSLFQGAGRRNQPATYHASRKRIATGRIAKHTTVVLVLDDLPKVTASKLALLRFLLVTSRFRLLVITESFLPAEDVHRLRALLYPSTWLTLGRLSRRAAIELLGEACSELGLDWPPERARHLACALGGYPFGLLETAQRTALRQRGHAHGGAEAQSGTARDTGREK